ncbi:hypothetical protein [Microlunatus ginsengisoli]|uniref:Uncharacterized protein n=1 Tax=Microlunatus ginsengisoli TaxID=363863 RepID=A0ABP7AL94_9ACTN
MLGPEPSDLPEPREPQPEQTFFYRDDEIPADEVAGFAISAPYARDRDAALGQLFRSNDELLDWVRGRPEEVAVARLAARVDRVRALPRNQVDNDQLIARRRRSVERIMDDMAELASQTGDAVDSAELFHRATRPDHPLEVPVFDPVSWFTSTNATGFLPFTNWLPMGGGFWRLAWFGWSNRPRSWRYSGWVWAFDGEFWNGASVLTGWFPFGYGPLAAWGMDMRVSSALVA